MKKDQAINIALVGNPNAGKTTLFNALTGSKQTVGNWPGVTVEQKAGFFSFHEKKINVVDLPGLYSLITVDETTSIDEKIANQYILSNEADVFVNIIDGNNLERNLYLTLQLLEMHIPVIVVVNMLDLAAKNGVFIDANALSNALGCPVFLLDWKNKQSLIALKQALAAPNHSISTRKISYHPTIEDFIQQFSKIIAKQQDSNPQIKSIRWLILRLLEGDISAQKFITAEIHELFTINKNSLETKLGEESDILVADSRYSHAHQIAQQFRGQQPNFAKNLTYYLDKIILHRILGIPIFLCVMYLMFLFAINIGGAFQDFFDILSNTFFVQAPSYWLSKWHVPSWFTAIIAVGIGKGINTTVTFIPVIGGMYLFLSFLEDTGYMARAAFVMDRAMRALGLPGKSFVPLIVGFGCNVPAIMSARTLENNRDRILTVLMTPFMSCGARLAIFAVVTSAFFPRNSQNIVFILYLAGISCAIITGVILRKTLLAGEPSPLVLELPPYHCPRVHTMMIHTWNRLKNFLLRAGRLIVPICVLIGALNAINLNGTLNLGDASDQSILSVLGRNLTLLFAPLGITQENWPATVGLLTGILAKEVVVGTLNTLYTQAGHLTLLQQTSFSFYAGITTAVQSIWHNLAALQAALINPIFASAPAHNMTDGVLGQMYRRFDGKIGAFAYLLFVLLYLPCVSTIAAIARELGKNWTMFSIFWNTCFAYSIALLFYQWATWWRHPKMTLIWTLGWLIFYVLIILILRQRASSKNTLLYKSKKYDSFAT